MTIRVHRLVRYFKDEGIDVVLVNSNPATIMTDRGMATNTYIGAAYRRICRKDYSKNVRTQLSPGMGGQTGLNPRVSFTTRAFLKV